MPKSKVLINKTILHFFPYYSNISSYLCNEYLKKRPSAESVYVKWTQAITSLYDI